MPLLSILKTEWLLQCRRPFVWFCFLGFFALGFLDTMQTGLQSEGNSWLNGAAMICNRGIIYSLLGTVAIAGIMLEPFVRDRCHGAQEMLLTTGASRLLRGPARFIIAFGIVTLATCLLIPGMILGTLVPGIPEQAIGPFNFSHYLKTVGWFLLPNFFLISAVIFWVGNRYENRSACFGTAVALLASWVTFRMLLGVDVFREDVFARYALLDPFGSIATFEFTREHSISEKNVSYIPLASLLLYNRLIWLSVACIVFLAGVFAIPERLRMERRQKKMKKNLRPSRGSRRSAIRIQPSSFSQMWSTLCWDLRLIWRQPSCKITICLVAFSLWWSAASAATVQHSLPSTDLLVHHTDYYFDKILMLAIFWLAGSLLWQDRSLQVDEMLGTQPSPDSAVYMAKTAALMIVVVCFWLISIAVNILFQLSHGYHRLELGLYAVDSFIFKAPYYLWFSMLAIALQAIIRNRYIAFLAGIVVALFSVLLNALGVRHPIFHFAHVSHVWYSLIDGYGHFWKSHVWMLIYWTLGALSLWLIGWGIYQRSRQRPPRLKSIASKYHGIFAVILPVTISAFLLTGVLVYHLSRNHGNWPPVDEDQIKADIEKSYGASWRGKAQPRITGIDAVLDLFPEERRYRMEGTFTLENQSKSPISEVMILGTPGLKLESIHFASGATRHDSQPEMNLSIWRLENAIAPGESTTLQFITTRSAPEGLAIHFGADSIPDVAPNEMISNGTAMLNLELMPVIGYTDRVEHKPTWKRKKYGLSEEWHAPEGSSAISQGHGTLHLSWVRHHQVTIRTSADQTALYGGKLIDSWKEENGRNAFRYSMTNRSRGWSAIISGRYEKRVFTRRGIPNVEVYYDPQHEAAVDTFGRSLQDAIEHFSSRYGPPPFETFRLAENSLHYDGFGSRGGLAHCSEILGWKADLQSGGTEAIQRYAAIMVALSWWGDQIIPANVKGAKVIHSGLPYWTAALYLKQLRKTDTDRKLRLQTTMEMFRGRGEMLDQEAPFLEEFKDSTMIRNKGSILILYLAERMGTEKLESILAEWLESWRGREAPYPTANDFYAFLKRKTPQELHPFLTDTFEKVTLWRLAIEDYTLEQRPDGKWKIRMSVVAEKGHTHGWGDEQKAPLNTLVQVVAFRNKGFTKDSIIRSEWLPLHSGQQWVEWTLDEKPAQVGCDPYLLLPDPNPQNNIKRIR